MFVLSAVTAASASAASPEFGGLNAKFPVKFTVASSNTYIWEGGGTFQCRSFSGEGSITGHKSGTAVLKLSKCNALPRYCHQVGKPDTEMETAELEVVPVYIPKTKAVALEFRPKSGTTFAHLTCPGANAELKGSILATVTPTNEQRTVFTLKFTQTGGGTQTPSQYEGEKGELVNSWLELGYIGSSPMFQREAWESTVTLTTEKALEIVG